MKTLEKLDKLLAMLPDNAPPREGEFTVYDAMARHGMEITHANRQKMSGLLRGMVDNGSVSVRKGAVDGRCTNIYKLK